MFDLLDWFSNVVFFFISVIFLFLVFVGDLDYIYHSI